MDHRLAPPWRHPGHCLERSLHRGQNQRRSWFAPPPLPSVPPTAAPQNLFSSSSRLSSLRALMVHCPKQEVLAPGTSDPNTGNLLEVAPMAPQQTSAVQILLRRLPTTALPALSTRRGTIGGIQSGEPATAARTDRRGKTNQVTKTKRKRPVLIMFSVFLLADESASVKHLCMQKRGCEEYCCQTVHAQVTRLFDTIAAICHKCGNESVPANDGAGIGLEAIRLFQ